MTVEIEIVNLLFKCKDDKMAFMQRLSEVCSIQKITICGTSWHLTVRCNRHGEFSQQISELCQFWNASYRYVT